MDDRIRTFIAHDCWLLIAIVTFAVISLVGMAGLESLAGVIAIVGWFLLTPIFLFWGEEIAALLEDDGSTTAEPTSQATRGEASAIDELKRRYAAGEIDDEEFERRLERLVAVDELPDDLFSSSSANATAERPRNREPERER